MKFVTVRYSKFVIFSAKEAMQNKITNNLNKNKFLDLICFKRNFLTVIHVEEHCPEPGLPARGDYVIVSQALSQESQVKLYMLLAE